MYWFLILISCSSEQQVIESTTNNPDPVLDPGGDDSGDPDGDGGGGGGSDGGSGDGGGVDGGSSDGGANDGGSGDGGDPEPDRRAPRVGDLLITELMIDPSAVEDRAGEWFELQNSSDAILDLSGLRVSDLGIDTFEPTPRGSWELTPGGVVVVCAAATGNGGVDCQATYTYDTFGGGLAFANTGDELVVTGEDGSELDRVVWTEADVPTGAALGLDPRWTSPSENDQMGRWCAQSALLSGGDAGTPGAANDGC
jgi:Lamin Tail Domain